MRQWLEWLEIVFDDGYIFPHFVLICLTVIVDLFYIHHFGLRP